ncbi:hypothetical protein [Sphingobium sp. Sx8-8]|uniref:hypothetical protein n=1 Tax=Sphingobium sp. Sx8-8 TaxID=2933617 RepID=UPI001F5A03AE|nr:hypothetical protein [Sphingobium sp. Sx8-8]
MNARFVDWIWHIKGSVALSPDQSGDDIFGKLDPLFQQPGTTHERTNDRLVFRKKDQAAQDKMAVFDGGTLQVEKDVAGSVLRYHLTSRALLYCFLAPLLFLAMGQLTIAIAHFDKPAAKSEKGTGKTSDHSKKDAKKETPLPMNPIDKALGAPAPEKKDADKTGDEKKKSSPIAAYVFAGLFAALYLIGRFWEARQVRNLFRKSLAGS